ncbi:PREDICTED: tubulin-folding cofactor B-like [Priapulus caudatus]|uniref:Tubulin-folding cofactor B-like n=1 Tax=Priapulus caudatus TaxID=37621 RepID=A0ABM1E6K7_PRICU|nr:PREDICTED: tubulin-folding cofactor B-like [Priapulus caudatus]
MASYSVVTPSVVKLTVTSSVNSFGSERRFEKDLTIQSLKEKLELLTGSTAANMKLKLYSKDDKLIVDIDSSSALLGSYPVEDGMRIHVDDPTIQAGEYEDVSKVHKFELTDEEYAKRSDSVKAFKEKHKLGIYEDPEKKEREMKLAEENEKQLAENIKIDDRCEVSMSRQPQRRGTVMFVGPVEFQRGVWVGVKLDEPMGKNNGSVQGKRYFECAPKYGRFIRPSQITVGDFPEEGMEDFDEL